MEDWFNEIVFTQLKGNFTKDFDTAGKMDPFALFTIGSCKAKTEVASGAGKVPVWTTPIRLTYDDDQTEVIIKAYDQDVTQNEYIGVGVVNLKTLKTSQNAITVEIIASQGYKVGEISGKYKMKQNKEAKERARKKREEKAKELNEIVFSQLKGIFSKDIDATGTMDPFALFMIGSCTAKTDVAQGAGKLPVWKNEVKLSYDDNQSEVVVKVYDSDMTQNEYIGVGIINLKTFKTESNSFIVEIKELQGAKIGEIGGKYSIKLSSEAKQKARKLKEEKDKLEQEMKSKNEIEEQKQKQAQIQKQKQKQSQINKEKQRQKELQKQKQKNKLLEQEKKRQLQLKNKLDKEQNEKKKKNQELKTKQQSQKPKSLIVNEQKMKQDKKKNQITEPLKQQKPKINDSNSNLKEKEKKPEQQKSIIQQSNHPSNSRSLINSSKLKTIQTLRNRWGDKIYDNQSSGTMQRSIKVYSMPKAVRFKYESSSTQGSPVFINQLTQSTVTKGAGIGFGNKKVMPQWVQRNMRQNPAPNAYFEKTQKYTARGPTFGISHQYYQKVLIPKEKPINKKNKLSPLKIKLPSIKL